MTRQTSIQLDDNTEALVAFLKDRGFGNTSNIIRVAVKRMAEEEARKVEYIPSKGQRTMKRFTATAGSQANPVTTTVEMRADGPLTPAQARAAAEIAFGHSNGVTVSDGTDAYRLSGKTVRKVSDE